MGVASHLNVGIALVHEGGVSQNTASFVMLSILLSVICVYWYCDFYRFRFALRFTYSPYIVLCVAFAGVVTNGGVDIEERPSSAYALALLVLAILGTVAKVVMGVMMRNTPDRKGSVMQAVRDRERICCFLYFLFFFVCNLYRVSPNGDFDRWCVV